MIPHVDPNTRTWMLLSRHLKVRIEELRDALETAVDEEKTLTLRGRIRELRLLIEAVEDQPAEETEEIGDSPPLY